MAVCNLFKDLTNPSGNFLMFSQYIEDITHNQVEGENWRVIPTRFVALDIDYSDLSDLVLDNNTAQKLNCDVPRYFQNYFENACAYGRSKTDWNGLNVKRWDSNISKNLFWNSMFAGNFIHSEDYGSAANNVKYIPEVKFFGDIDMHSYNEHKGMGYGEIYCYIPSDAEKMNCQVVINEDTNTDTTNNSIFLEGYPNTPLGNYSTEYVFENKYKMSFDNPDIDNLLNGSETRYNINTIVVLYSVFVEKIKTEVVENTTNRVTEWELLYDNIPMGMYIMGTFDNDNKLSNTTTKYVTTSYNTGTSYGLRICNRFSATGNGTLFNTDIVIDDSSYTNLCQLMSKMNENLSLMLDITKTTAGLTEQYKELESRLTNQKHNVPYVRNIDGIDYWFVNGKKLTAVGGEVSTGCDYLSPETVKQRLENLMDDDLTNDNTFIDDPNGPNCIPFTPFEVADKLGMENKNDYPDSMPPIIECSIIATNDEVQNQLDI